MDSIIGVTVRHTNCNYINIKIRQFKMVEFKPTYSSADSWHFYGDIWAKGFAFSRSGELLEGENLAKYVSKIENEHVLANELSTFNGLFALMGSRPFGCFAVADRVRSIPLFYTYYNNELSVSDSPYAICRDESVDLQSKNEFTSAGYCLGNRTLLKDVFQVEAGSIFLFNKTDAKVISYFNYTTDKTAINTYDQAKQKLKDIIDAAMVRLMQSIGGKHIAIPLSGGYDSRLIVAWLLKNGYRNFTAFTYGREGNNEMGMAKQVARTLNINWIPITYSEKAVKGIVDDGFFDDYIPFASLACSMPFFQDYTAAKLLKTSNLIPRDSVIVPGHSGDFLAGSHLYPKHKAISDKSLIKYILRRHHTLLKVDKNAMHSIAKQVEDFIKSVGKTLPHSKLEWRDFKERQAKFIVNSTRTYQYFDYKLRLPLFDSELIEFFKTLPFDVKLVKRLYVDVIEEEYFIPMNIYLKNELQPTENEIRIQQIKDTLKDHIPWLKRFEKRSADNNCYTETARELFNTTGIDRVFSIDSKSTNAPIVEWYLKYFDVKIGDWILRENKI